MNKLRYKKLLNIFLLICIALSAAPLGAVIQLGASEGLSNGFVTSVAEDAKGNLWVTTEDGLNRWNGITFRSYMPGNSNIAASELNCIIRLPGDDRHMWIGTQYNGICVLDIETGHFETLLPPTIMTRDIANMTVAQQNGIWVTHYHYGPQLYDPATGKAGTPITRIIKNLPQKSWTTVEGHDHKLYVGHVDNGFSIVDTIQKKFINFTYPELPGNSVYAICIDNNDNVWLGTDGGVALFNTSTRTITRFIHDPDNPESIRRGAVHSICQMRNGEIWFATSQGGISILDVKSYTYRDIEDATFRSLPINSYPDGTSSAYIRSIFQDSHGNIWLGNYRAGIDFISRMPELFSRINYLNDYGSNRYNAVWCSARNQKGEIWMGAENEIVRLDKYDHVTERVPLPDGRNDNATFARALLVDTQSGLIWTGTNERGLMIYDPATRIWTRKALPSSNIRTFAADGDSILVGTNNGLYKVHRTSFATGSADRINRQLTDLVINTISIDNNGRIWIGTLGKGLHIFDRDARLLANHKIDNGFPSNAINNIIHGSDGSAWVASRLGLIRFNPNSISDSHKIEAVDQMDITHVMSLAEDYNGKIWLTSNKGIVKVNPETEAGSLYTGNITIPLHSFVEGTAASDNTDEIFFPSINGMIKVDPQRSTAPIEHVGIQATDLMAYNSNDISKSIRSIGIHDKAVTLKHNENTFSITFSIPDYAQMEHAEFSYNLEGLNDLWIETRGENVATFRDINPGTYRFLVRQRQNGGIWDTPECILTVTVKPPLWLTWWAKTIYLIIILTIVAAFIALYRHRYEMKRRLELERERNKNRQTLNEERLRFYTNVTHELRTPLTLIMGPLEDIVSDPTLPGKFAYKLQVIRNSANTLLNLIHGILEFRKTETQNRQVIVRHGSLANLVREIGLRFKELNQNRNVKITLDIENESPDIYFDSEMLTTIVNNLMSNAMKYTQKGEITLAFHTVTDADGTRRSVLSVTDTGFGISPKALEHIFERYYQENGVHQASGTGIGLALVKNLADLHQATLEATSVEGKGSVFTLSLLTDNNYPDALHAEHARQTPNTTSQTDENSGMTTEPDCDNLRKKILVVEDNDDIREYIRQTLADDADVITAANGLEGLDLTQQQQPDIVISDIMMPEMDGIAMCRAIKNDLVTSHIPVILLTAKDSLSDKEEGYESGADSYLTKPFSAQLLRIRIHNLLLTRRRTAEYILRQTVVNTPVEPEPLPDNRQSEPQNDPTAALTPYDRQFLDKLLLIINENLANEDLSVVFIADKMCMSNSTLYRKVTALLGISPNEYIRRIRISKAVELLRSRQWSITDIAFKTGFGSHSSFGKVFKKEFGMTPSEYLTSTPPHDNTHN